MAPEKIPLRVDFNFPGCETTPDELEFGLAMYAYQKKHGRRFPAWSEVLYVLRALGYAKGLSPEPFPPPPRPYGPGLSHTPSLAEIESCS